MMRTARYLPLCGALALVACGTTTPVGTPVHKPAPASPRAAPQEPGVPALPAANSGRGAYYQDDGPGDNPPAGLLETPDAEVRLDPVLPRSNKPYVVFGKTYTPVPPGQPFTQKGLGTWYGKKFHGQRTSSGELYDMYKMTAAHPTLPIPSYARVTNVSNGNSVVVRINDRGPFHSTRIIDVSYTAALKLGLLVNGSTQLQVDLIMPSEIEQMLASRKPGAPAPTPTPTVMPKAAPMLAVATPEKGAEAMLAGGAAPDVLPGYYLQLGTYSRAEGADTLRGKLADAASDDKFEVAQAGAMYRVYAGPYASRDDAEQAKKRLPAGLKLKPIIIQR